MIPEYSWSAIGDRIRVTAGFREGKNVFKNNDFAKSVWELIQALQRSESQIRAEMQPHQWAARQAKIIRDMGMER
jgi:hypothetical protein